MELYENNNTLGSIEDIIGRKSRDLTREPNYRIIDPTNPNGPKYLGRINVQNLKAVAEIIHYAEIYKTSLRYHNAMEHSKDPDRYYRDHATELNLFNAAEHVLHDKYNINPALMNYQHMQDSYKLM